MRILQITLLCLFVSGCATSYSPHGLMGGYSSNNLQDNIYNVEFKGNAYISFERCYDYTLLRASEITLEKNFKYFRIIGDKSKEKISTEYASGNSYTRGTIDQSGNFQSFTNNNGYAYTESKPRINLFIELLNEKPQSNDLIFDAIQIKNNLSSKYKLRRK